MSKLLLPLLMATPTSAGLYGNLIGVGLADCKASHPQLLSKWAFNATTSTLSTIDNLPACKSHDSCQVVKCLIHAQIHHFQDF